MGIFGRRKADLERRQLEQIELVTDIGLAFTAAQIEAMGMADETIPAVYRSAQIITDSVASLPMVAVGADGITEPVTPPILETPNRSEPYQTTMEKLVSSLIWRGNAYLWVTQRSRIGEIEGIVVLDPDEVSVSWDRNRLFPVYAWRDREVAADREIFHIAINHWPGRLTGVGPITAARLMLQGVKAEAAFARHLMEDEATPSGLLMVPQRLEKDEAEAVQGMWEAGHQGRKRPAVLSGGVDFKPITLNPVDAQFIEQRKYSIAEIARIFGVFGVFLLIEDGGSLTYSTTEGLFRLFVATTLRPTYLERIEATFSRMLPGRERAQFVTAELLEADLASRYASYEVGLRAGFLTVDEVRRAEHLPRLEPASRTPAPAPAGGGEGNGN